MEFKDIILGSENTLPTAQDAVSTATAQPSLPTVTASASTWWKFGASSVCGLVGGVMLWSGKKNNDLNKMLIGAALTLASFFMF